MQVACRWGRRECGVAAQRHAGVQARRHAGVQVACRRWGSAASAAGGGRGMQACRHVLRRTILYSTYWLYRDL